MAETRCTCGVMEHVVHRFDGRPCYVDEDPADSRLDAAERVVEKARKMSQVLWVIDVARIEHGMTVGMLLYDLNNALADYDNLNERGSE